MFNPLLSRLLSSSENRTQGSPAHLLQIIQTTRSRSSIGWPHPRLGNLLLRTETASLLVGVDDHVRFVLGRLVVPVVVGFPTRSTVFRSSPRVSLPRVALKNFACCWLCSFLHGFWGPIHGCLSFFTSIWYVSTSQLLTTWLGVSLRLKASAVHDRCTRRRSGHVAKQLAEDT